MKVEEKPAEVKYLCSVLDCRDPSVTPLPDLWCAECLRLHREGFLFLRHIHPKVAEASA